MKKGIIGQSESAPAYGAIELKNVAKKNTGKGFTISVIIHLFIFGLYVGWSALANTTHSSRQLKVTPVGFVEFPPPSVESNPTNNTFGGGGAPVSAALLPKFGTPIPVPDLLAESPTLPDINLPVSPVGKAGDTGTYLGSDIQGSVQGTITLNEDLSAAKRTIPIDTFIAVDEDPVPIQNIQSLIVYPEVAKRSSIEGKVVLSAFIDEAGKVASVRIDKSDNEIFNTSAIEAMQKVRFTPARLNGKPVGTWWTLPISFRLNH